MAAYKPRRQHANMNKGFGNARAQLRGRGRSQSFSPNKGFAGAKPGLSAAGPKPGLGVVAAGVTPKPVAKKAQPDSVYQGQIDLANRKQTYQLGQLEGQATSIRHDFGIDDPTNPFSRVEGLKRAFLARSKAASAGLAAQGHLYSGQAERALARTRRDEEEARANLRSQYDQAINTVGASEAGVKFNTEEQKNQAFEDWLARAPESQGSVSSPAVAIATAPGKPPTPSKPTAAAPVVAQVPAASKVPAAAGPKTSPVKSTPGASTNRSFQPVKGPDKPKPDVEHELRKRLRDARRKGQTKRVVRIRKRIRALNQGSNYTRD